MSETSGTHHVGIQVSLERKMGSSTPPHTKTKKGPGEGDPLGVKSWPPFVRPFVTLSGLLMPISVNSYRYYSLSVFLLFAIRLDSRRYFLLFGSN